MILKTLLLLSFAAAVSAEDMLASDPRVDWSGRRIAAADGSVSFDWLGVAARVAVEGAS
jgi:hypothetical protein